MLHFIAVNFKERTNSSTSVSEERFKDGHIQLGLPHLPKYTRVICTHVGNHLLFDYLPEAEIKSNKLQEKD